MILSHKLPEGFVNVFIAPLEDVLQKVEEKQHGVIRLKDTECFHDGGTVQIIDTDLGIQDQ